MFVSTFFHSIDAKGRLSIPASFRDWLRSNSMPEVFYLTKAPDQKIILAYPQDRYNEIIANLTDPATGVVNQQVLRGLTANTVECLIDKQCRIIVPQRLREYAGILRDVAVLGVGKRVEFWDKKAWEESEKKNQGGSIPESVLY
jgi:MraZ protein